MLKFEDLYGNMGRVEVPSGWLYFFRTSDATMTFVPFPMGEFAKEVKLRAKLERTVDILTDQLIGIRQTVYSLHKVNEHEEAEHCTICQKMNQAIPMPELEK